MKFNQVELCWNFIIGVDFRKWSHFLFNGDSDHDRYNRKNVINSGYSGIS